jgi:DNA-binding response OmpR family regulator
MNAAPRVLIVEDNVQLRDSLAAAFSRMHYEPLLAGDGKSAVKMASEQAVDLMVCDIILPNMDGIAAIAEIRKIDPAMAILAVTGMGRRHVDDLSRLALLAGANEILRKPFKISALAEHVSRLMAQPRSPRAAPAA